VVSSTGTLCQATTKGGQPCSCYALAGSEFCFWHAPEAAEARKLARVKGGQARQGRSGVLRDGRGVSLPLKSMADVVQLLEKAVGDVLVLENSISRARAVGYLCSVAVKALEVSDLEERITRLEERLGVS